MDETISSQLADAQRWIAACEEVIRGLKKERADYRAEVEQLKREIDILKTSECKSCKWFAEYTIGAEPYYRCNLRGENTEPWHYCRKHENSLK